MQRFGVQIFNIGRFDRGIVQIKPVIEIHFNNSFSFIYQLVLYFPTSTATELSRTSLFMKNSRKNPLFRQILVATLLVGGASQIAAPVLAQTTPLTSAGTSISNTGTATYEDPNAQG